MLSPVVHTRLLTLIREDSGRDSASRRVPGITLDLRARSLYRTRGFVECPPFGDYAPDANSIFMSLDLRGS